MQNQKVVLFHTSPSNDSFNAQDLNGREIASRMSPEKFLIYFLANSDDIIDPKLKKDNVKIIRLRSRVKIFTLLERLYYKMTLKREVSFYIRVFFEDSVFLFLKKLFKLNIFTVHMIENVLPYPNDSNAYQFFARFNARNSDRVFPISTYVKKTLLDEYGLDGNIIPIGVNNHLFNPTPTKFDGNSSTLKVICCGTLQERKRPLIFAKLAKKYPSISFTWFGEGDLFPAIEKYIKQNEICNCIFSKNLKHSELAKRFSEADIFLFPSVHEGFPKVLVEAMASGLPCVVMDTYGPESVIDGETGFVCKTDEELNEKLKYLIKNTPVRKEMSRKAVVRAKNFTWEKVTSMWEREIDCNERK